MVKGGTPASWGDHKPQIVVLRVLFNPLFTLHVLQDLDEIEDATEGVVVSVTCLLEEIPEVRNSAPGPGFKADIVMILF